MKKELQNKRNQKLAGYSALAAAFIAIGADADAQIVYTDIIDLTINIDEGYILDLNGDGFGDFVFQAVEVLPGVWTAGIVQGILTSYSVGGPSNAVIGYTGPILPYASALNASDPIGAAADFVTNSYNQAFLASIYSGVTYGPFADVTDKYLGVKFLIGADLYYSWFRLDVTVDPITITIKDYAYNSNPDESLIAGEISNSTIDFAEETLTVNEAVGIVPVTVNITDAADCTIGVEINGALTTASDGSDFVFADPSPLTFTAGGGTSLTFDVEVADDIEFEIPETIVFDLVDITGGCLLGAADTYTLTINDNDAPPAISFVSAEEDVNENDGLIPVTVTISEPSDCTVDITLNAVLTTATDIIDFSYSIPDPVIFLAGGPASQTFDINIIDDIEIETIEDIVFDLTSITGCITGAIDSTTIHILDNDAIIPSDLEFLVTTATITEDDVNYTGEVSLSENNTCTVEVTLNIGLSSATEGIDFTFDSPQILNFTIAGALAQEFDINIVEDLAVEGDEDIVFELNNLTGDCILTGSDAFTLTITDDDQVGLNTLEGSGINLYSFGNSIIVAMQEMPSDNSIIQIADVSGKEIFNSQITSKNQTFSIHSIAEGIYIVRILMDGKSFEKNVWLGQK